MIYLALYLAVTVAGYFIGVNLKKRNVSLPWIGTVQTIVILCLVFLMGSRIGANDEIVSSLNTIGLVSLAFTLIILLVTIMGYSIARRLMGFDRYGVRHAPQRQAAAGSPAAGIDPESVIRGAEPAGRERAMEEAVPAKAGEAIQGENPGRETEYKGGPVDADPAVEEKKEDAGHGINHLTILIVIFMAIGIAAGYFFLPQSFIAITGTMLTVSLCTLLVFIGIDIGTAGTLAQNFRGAGWRVLVFPFVSMVSMMAASVVAALVLPIGVQDGLCIGSGFAWYSLAPVMLAEYSTRISAISFMHNVFREVLGILLVPTVARRVGYIECICLGGSTSMDVCLPVIERSTNGDVAVYAFINGAVISASVPILVSIFMSL